MHSGFLINITRSKRAGIYKIYLVDIPSVALKKVSSFVVTKLTTETCFCRPFIFIPFFLVLLGMFRLIVKIICICDGFVSLFVFHLFSSISVIRCYFLFSASFLFFTEFVRAIFIICTFFNH